jgi:preprotein translocase subunit SecB
MKLHAIQLLSLGVRELSISSNVQPSPDVGADTHSCSIKIGSTDYNRQEKTIGVSLRLESGTDPNETEAPFVMKIELVGLFQVDESLFPVEHISDWATQNAPFILFPYLREHAFGLSSRCGFQPLLLPLLEVPTFQIEQPKIKRKEPKTKSPLKSKSQSKEKPK